MLLQVDWLLALFLERSDIFLYFKATSKRSAAAKQENIGFFFLWEWEDFFWDNFFFLLPIRSSHFFIVRSNRLYASVITSTDRPTQCCEGKHNCQSVCVHLMPKQQLRALMVSAEGQEVTCYWLLTWGMEDKVQGGRVGLTTLYSFMTSDFMLHDMLVMLSDVFRTDVILSLLLYLFLSIHPLLLNVWM